MLSSTVIQNALEDESFLYWLDTTGAIYKCATSDLANCESKKVLLTAGATATCLFQDAKNLYWGTMGTSTVFNAQLLRMAK